MEQITIGTMAWPGWMGGIAIAIVMLMCYWVTGKALGASRAYCSVLASFSQLSFFQKAKAEFNTTRIWLLLGIPLGALLSTPEAEWKISSSMGAYYDALLPSTPWLKALVLFAGGSLMGIGARMAGGCTSGTVIVGISNLNLPSMVAGALFFGSGLITVQILFRLLA